MARSRDRTTAAYREAIDDALAVVRQLGALVESLLALARLDANRESPARGGSIDLAELVGECYAALAPRSLERGLTFVNRVLP